MVEGKTLVNSSKSDFLGTEVANLNIMYEHLSKLEIIVYKKFNAEQSILTAYGPSCLK